MKFNQVPKFADDYPKIATTIDHMKMSIYCINCLHKEKVAYLTPDFGPFCKDCIKELETTWQIKTEQNGNL